MVLASVYLAGTKMIMRCRWFTSKYGEQNWLQFSGECQPNTHCVNVNINWHTDFFFGQIRKIGRKTHKNKNADTFTERNLIWNWND